MSITDELREYALGWDERNRVRCDLTAIADRIDAEHQKALDEWKAKHGQMWLKGYSECHAELLEGNETLASDLERCGWIRLPVDADGEYIHAGDVLDGYGKTIEVVEMRHGRSGWVIISRDGNAYADTYAFSHRQPDSWERIIEDAEALAREWFNTDMSENEHADGLNALVARCKKLAGDAE